MQIPGIAFLLRQDIFEIDTLHAGLFHHIEVLVVGFRCDVTTAVPILVTVTYHGKLHARFRTDVQTADRDIHLHREEFCRSRFRNGKHRRHVRTV